MSLESLESTVAALVNRVEALEERLEWLARMCAGCGRGPRHDDSVCSACDRRYCRACRAAEQWGCRECGRYASDMCRPCVDEMECKCGG